MFPPDDLVLHSEAPAYFFLFFLLREEFLFDTYPEYITLFMILLNSSSYQYCRSLERILEAKGSAKRWATSYANYRAKLRRRLCKEGSVPLLF